jgi:hypothetical protein
MLRGMHMAGPPGAPPNDEGRGASAAQVGEQINTDIASVSDFDGDRKALATLKARAARAGYLLHELDGGEYLISRWSQSTQSLPDLRAVRAVMRRMGIPE